MAETNAAGLAGLMNGQPDDDRITNPDDRILIDPVDGRLIEADDADALIESLETADAANATLQSWRGNLKRRLANMRPETDTKTQRVRGKTRTVKIVNQSDYISSPILESAWNAYPQFREEFLKVAGYKIKVREFKKALTTAGEPDFNTFCKVVASAVTKNEGVPKITIEELKTDGS